MPNTIFNASVLELWRNTFSSKENVLAPLIYPPLIKRQLLFIGFNPSFSERGLRRCLKDSKYSDLNLLDFYRWHNTKSFDLDAAIEIEQLTKAHYPYFRKFKEISVSTDLDWQHIDLFFFRTNQKESEKRNIKNPQSLELTVFGQRQLELSKDLIENIAPKIIVVSNAFASRLFEKYYNCKFNEDLGFHETLIKNTLTPVFLGSMLSGQRAMDNYSFQRLKWQINKAFENLSRVPTPF